MISFIYCAACCQLLLVAILKSQILYIYKTPNCIITLLKSNSIKNNN